MLNHVSLFQQQQQSWPSNDEIKSIRENQLNEKNARAIKESIGINEIVRQCERHALSNVLN